jgi:hypothetical protein
MTEDDKISAPGSSPEATTDVPAESSPANAGATATDSPAVETVTEVETPVEKPGRSAKETLIAKLTGAEEDDTEDPEDGPAVETAEKPAETTATPESKENVVATEVASTEPAKPEFSEDELIAPVDKHTKPATRKRIEALIADRKAKIDEFQKQKPLADYGQSVLKLCSDANMTAEDFGAWFAFGTAVNADPKNAPLLLQQEAERMAKALNVELPQKQALPVLSPAIQDLEEFVIESVTSMELSGDTAKKILEKIRAAKKGSAPAQSSPPPAPVQQPAPTAQNPPPQIQQRDPMQDPVVRQAAQEITTLTEGYAKAIPADWAKIQVAANEQMKKYAGTDPRHWPAFFKQEVEAAKAKFVVPKKPTIPQTLRPTSGTADKKPLAGKAEAMALLTGKIT